MNRQLCGPTLALLLTLAAPALGQQYYLYTPKPVEGEPARSREGVLVREVPIKKGDTLSGISRRFSGHASYFPQILLFNEIKNPDLIYAGDSLKVPVTREEGSAAPRPKGKGAKPRAEKAPPAAAAPERKEAPRSGLELSPGELQQIEPAAKTKPKKTERVTPKKGTPPQPKATAVPPSPRQEPVAAPAVTPREPQKAAPAASSGSSSQKLFERAMQAYRQDDCRTALELFDRFLTAAPDSPLAADASLYKAECYLKQSAQ